VTTDAPGVTQWGFSFSYDGYGNLTGKTVTKGSPSGGGFSAAYDVYNHQVGQGYDANGNQLPSGSGSLYDIENRLEAPTTQGACEFYGYDSSNKRIWKMVADQTEEFYFYGIDGRKMGTYVTNGAWTAWSNTMLQRSTNLYFARKMVRSQDKTVVLDRLGSVRANVNTGERFSYYPYGEEVAATAQGREKFGTYTRDATGLDYADQRYYSSAPGRFLTPDPYSATVTSLRDPANPQTWNRYAYVEGDPVNFVDPSGLAKCWVPETYDGPDGRTVKFQCETILGTFRQRYVSVPPNMSNDAYVRMAEQTLGEELDREDIFRELVPLAALARIALRDANCAAIFSGKDVISPTAALDSVFIRINYSFGQVISLTGPRSSEQAEMDSNVPVYFRLASTINQSVPNLTLGLGWQRTRRRN